MRWGAQRWGWEAQQGEQSLTVLLVGSRSPSVQQRALLCHALWDGDQVLQWPRSTFPYEEGAAFALEDCVGKGEDVGWVSVCVLQLYPY